MTADTHPAMPDRRDHADLVRELTGRWPEHHVAPSLNRIRELCELLGEPQRSAPVIQITGTNGKGSTAIMIDALCRAMGLRTGRFSSPHLQDITERICVDGQPISAELFDEVWRQIEPLAHIVDEQRLDGVPLTFFEAMTGLAYAVFADAPVDVMVMEVGMGGRWDATNVADAQVAVLCPVDFDHMNYLGNTIEQIAGEKSGIIKPGATVVSAMQRPEALRVIARASQDAGARLLMEGVDFGLLDRQPAVGGQLLRLDTANGPVGDLFLPLFGEHMAHNAALAVAAVEALFGEHGLDAEVMRTGLEAVRAPARLEVVHHQPTVVLDTAHNPHGVRATLEGVAEAFDFAPLIAVVAMMADKQVEAVLTLLEPQVDHVIVTQVSGTKRAMPVEDLSELAEDIFDPARVDSAPSVEEALAQAMQLADQSGPQAGVLVIGSVYLAGEARGVLQRLAALEGDDLPAESGEDGVSIG